MACADVPLPAPARPVLPDDLPGWSAADQARLTAALGTGPFQARIVDEAHFTGYFEPEFDGSRQRSATFHVPLLAAPATLSDKTPIPTRSQIAAGALDGLGLELAWLSDPLDAFLMQVQGSGRVRLAEGSSLRLGFAGRNGHPYRSIGHELVQRGEVRPEDISMQAIRDWAARHPDQLPDLLAINPSYVFFRKLDDLPEDAGPLGTAGKPLTPLASIAVDPAHIPLGSPVWVEVDDIRALMIAEDTGSAIIGPARADIFFGTGAAAGERAGRLNATGRMIVFERAAVGASHGA